MIDLALKLRPTARRVAFVAGAAEQDRQDVARERAALERYAGRLGMQDIVGLERHATIEAVRALPSDAVVLYLTAFRYGAGHPLVPCKLQSEGYTGPITISNYQKLQWIREQLMKDGFNIPLPTGN